MGRFLLTFVVVAIISTSTHVDGKAVDDVELRAAPTVAPTAAPTAAPNAAPTAAPTAATTAAPTAAPTLAPTAAPPAAPTTGPVKYYVDDGCHDETQEKRDTDDYAGVYQAANLKAGVRCCSNDGKTIIDDNIVNGKINNGKERFCTTLGSCNRRNGVTLEEAVQQCTDAGYRLCTKEELMSDECCGTGGNCDSHLVWTSTTAEVSSTALTATQQSTKS